MGQFKQIYHALCGSVFSEVIKNEVSNLDFIMMNTPRHGNMGDHAIAYAEKLFFEKYFPDIRYGEITGPYLWKYIDIYKKYISKDTVLGISGGGYLGNIWFNEEVLIRIIFEYFPENKIVFFPQTVFFNAAENRTEEIEKSRKTYSEHRAPVMAFFRDRLSFDFGLNEYKSFDKIFEAPDMALFLKPEFDIEREQEAVIIFRHDAEKSERTPGVDKIEDELRLKNVTYKILDTVVGRRISTKKRNKEFIDILKRFASAKFVITDRLHGMIMSAITGTPCLAFDNLTGKVSGCYKWIENIDYIRILRDESELESGVDWIIDAAEKKWNYDNKHLEKYYEKMADEIRLYLQS